MVTSPSDAPVRARGTHTRSGNAMLRTRAAILDATARCVERSGVRKTTMSDVSAQAKVAKATLYNHFRTKDDLLAALVLARTVQLTSECAELAGAGLAPALEHAGRSLGTSGPLRRVAADEPALLALFGTPAPGRLWDTARHGVQTVLRESGAPSDPVSVDFVLRWLCGHALWEATADELMLGARILAAGLGRAPEAVEEPLAVSPSHGDVRPPVAGVGWPS
ncbi:MAG: transcriptional regulator, TetR family [Frankiales bacterium]|nr:transcriptional regulator, TetR family [Frankiales bacterium]